MLPNTDLNTFVVRIEFVVRRDQSYECVKKWTLFNFNLEKWEQRQVSCLCFKCMVDGFMGVICMFNITFAEKERNVLIPRLFDLFENSCNVLLTTL